MFFMPTARMAAIAGFAISAVIALIGPHAAAAEDLTAACDTAAGARFDQDRPPSVPPVDLAGIDVAKATTACQASAAATPSDRRQIYQLGRAYLAAKDYAKAFDAFKKASDLGSAMAMSDLATMTEAGLGTTRDPVAARALAEKSASAGNAQGIFVFALMNANGHGGPKDLVKARTLMERAAEAGVPKARFQFGYAAELGLGGPVDLQKARTAYVACSNEPTPGSSQAVCQRRLGFLMATGKFGRPDFTAAKILFDKAANTGDVDATRALGQLYERGDGVPKDYAKAREYYEKAAAKGDSGAMRLLAGIYERGEGVPRDAAAAKSWNDRAKAAGDTEKALKDAGTE
jgi:TPR repeat protein